MILLNAGQFGAAQTALATNVAVLGEQLAEFFFAGVPFGAPIFGDGDAETDRISFLSHTERYSSERVILMWQLRLRIGPAEPRALGVNRLRVEAVWATASLT